MSGPSRGTPCSSSAAAGGPPAAARTQVKEQIRTIVEDLELVLGDLKDVARELKEVSRAQGAGRAGWPMLGLGDPAHPVGPPGPETLLLRRLR